MKYHIWTIGCQMNTADSLHLGAALEAFGCEHTADVHQADVIVLNTCVVRQSAEDRAAGFLWSLKPLKERRPATVIALMGCMVGVKGNSRLQDTFRHVDVLVPPGQPAALIDYLRQANLAPLPPHEPLRLPAAGGCGTQERPRTRPPRGQGGGEGAEHPLARLTSMERGLGAASRVDLNVLPLPARGRLISAPVPVLLGCNHVCSYCIIPARRGRERSRPMEEVLSEVRALAMHRVREVVLLGQIVDRYGLDLGPGAPRLPDLLAAVSDVQGIARVRFLTSHPNYFDGPLIEAIRGLPKVCEHIEVPMQAGDDDILRRMRREHTADDYRRLIARIREQLPGCSIATDVIVGFPGETERQFQATLDLLSELRMDVCHVAVYSSRPGTLAAKSMPDDVPPLEKKRRLDAVNALQEQIAADINLRLLGQRVQILVEGKQKGRWKGRTRTNKLVFFEDEDGARAGWRGQLVQVMVTWTGPWSMQAMLEHGSGSEE